MFSSKPAKGSGPRSRGPKLAVRSQVWLEVEGRRIFSIGRMQLLEAIDAEGSIQKAAEGLNMSYRAAWGKLKATEEALGVTLLERSTGGSKGGGARLTNGARDLMARYRSCWEAVNAAADESFSEAFSQPAQQTPLQRKRSSRTVPP